jgi:branched-chain amino acid transport system permease protein
VRVIRALQAAWDINPRKNPNAMVYWLLIIVAIALPIWAQAGGGGSFLLSQAGDAGVFILLALGLNVVVGFAGLLDLGYAAFFAIGAYAYAFLASDHLAVTAVGQGVHLPFFVVLFLAMFVAAFFGVLLGAPTLRLRGDYLAIVTLGFGEIVPRVFRNGGSFTGGVNGISALDLPELPVWIEGPWSGDQLSVVRDFKIIDPLAYYVLMLLLVGVCVVLVNNLYRSRLGRAWMAVREDEVAAAAMGVNTVRVKLLAFAIGAAFSGFAGAYYGSKLSLVSPENFGFVVSITILIMVVLGGMGNIAGVIVGALLIYYINFNVLSDLPNNAANLMRSIGLEHLNSRIGEDWPGTAEMVTRLKFLIFGLILVLTMLLRPQGLIPSRVREQELVKGTQEEPVAEVGLKGQLQEQ